MQNYRDYLKSDIEKAANERAIMPYKWDGSHGYVVGPFKKQQVAAYFAEYIALPILSPQRVVAIGEAWYLDARFEGASAGEGDIYERSNEAA